MDLRGGNGGGDDVASAVAAAAASTGSTGLWRPHRPIIGLYFGKLLFTLSEEREWRKGGGGGVENNN